MSSGSVFRRPDGRWRAQWREYPGGPQRSKHFGRKADAERHLTEMLHGLNTGTYIPPEAGKVTVQEYAELWRVAQVHRQSTADRLEVELRRRVYPTFGDRPIASVRPSEVQAWIKGMTFSLAPASVVLAARTFASLYRAAMRDRIVNSSPCDGMKLPEVPPTLVVPPAVETVHRLHDAAPDRMKAVVMVAAGAGLRQGEIYGLTVDRVDFLRRTIKVDRQLVTPKAGEAFLGPPKRPASVRTIPVGDLVVTSLARHLERFPAGTDGLIFTNESGEPIRRQRGSDLWRAVTSRAAVGDVRLHDLRHFYASALIRAGLSVKVVQHRLGHASAVETLDVYGHLWPDDEDRTRAAVDSLLAKPAGDSLVTEHG